MSDTRIINFDESYAKTILEKKHEDSEKRVGRLTKTLQGWQKEYDRLSKALLASEVVTGIGTATGFISSLALAGSSDFATIARNSQDLMSTPAGKVVLGVAMGSFIVAGAGAYLNDKIFGKMQENQDAQDSIYSELEFEEDVLKANENAQAINYLKGEIHGDEVYLPDDVRASLESDIPVVRESSVEMPRITIIDQRGTGASQDQAGPDFNFSADDLEQ